MNFLREIRFYLVIVSLGFLFLLTQYLKQSSELEKLKVGSNSINGGDILKAQTMDSLQYLVDSLHNENFICQIDKGRYEVALNIFAERNPKASKQLDEIISKETE